MDLCSVTTEFHRRGSSIRRLEGAQAAQPARTGGGRQAREKFFFLEGKKDNERT